MSAAYAALFLWSSLNSVVWFLLGIIFEAILMTISALLASSVYLIGLSFLSPKRFFCSIRRDVCALLLIPNYFESFILLFLIWSFKMSIAFTLYLYVISFSFSWAIWSASCRYSSYASLGTPNLQYTHFQAWCTQIWTLYWIPSNLSWESWPIGQQVQNKMPC